MSEPKDDRFVMHTGSSAASINNQSITGDVLTLDHSLILDGFDGHL